MLLKGKPVADKIKSEILEAVNECRNTGKDLPKIAILRVGNRPDDIAYESRVLKNCTELGIEAEVKEVDHNIDMVYFMEVLDQLNEDPKIHGILIFRPLPNQLDMDLISRSIKPEKDIDCMSPVNAEKIFVGDKSGIPPCTPEAVIEILKFYEYELSGKNVAIVNRSMVLGKPLSMLFLNENSTVTICHSKTKDLPGVTAKADIVVTGAGKAKIFGKEFFTKDSVIVDVGINADAENKLCGDVDFEEVSESVAAISPVPGGVGTVTSMILLNHVIKSMKLQQIMTNCDKESIMEKKPLKPAEITEFIISMAQDKVAGSFQKLFILGILAGAFIAFAAEGSNMAAFNLFAEPTTYGLGKALAGVVFGTGLMLVVLAGGELFTGNTMILAAVCDKKVTIRNMLRNWIIVYIGNFIGSVLIAYMMVHSGLFSCGADMLGAVTLKIAAYKVSLGFSQAFFLGIMCNWLVCLAVWISYGADTMAGKIFSIFFPIWLFITSGFEHSVANMYYIPAGIMIKENASFAELSHLSQEVLNSLTWGSFIVHNLVPVTLGNIVGGGIFVGMIYWYVYKKNREGVQT